MLRLASPSLVLVIVACANSPRPAGAPAAALAAPRPALVSPPGIRLPETFRPSTQRLSLTIVPSDEHFTGRTEIDGTLSAGTDVVWLNAELLDVTSASARSGGQEVPAEPVIGDDQRVALRFPRALPAGPLTLVLAFRGEISARESRGVFRRQSGGEWYAFTHFEPTSARRVFPPASMSPRPRSPGP